MKKARFALWIGILVPTLAWAHDLLKPITPLSDDSLTAQDIERYSQELCGERPTTPAQEEAELEKFHAIEKKMPAVKDQGYSAWCSVFSASDLLDYYLHSKTGEPYSDKNQASRLDLVSAINTLSDQHAQKPSGHLGSIDLDVSEDAPTVLFAAQNSGDGIRSQAEMRFSAQDSQLKELVDAAYQSHKKDLAILTKRDGIPRTFSETDKDFLDELQGLVTIDGSPGAVFSQGPASSKTSIDDYKVFADQEDLRNPIPRIHYPPFIANNLQTKDADHYLSTLNQVFAGGSPVTLSLCVYPVDPLNIGPSLDDGDTCAAHSITAVGAAWVDNECKIRLRNSWGKTWGTDPAPSGYIDLTVSQLLKTRYNYTAGVDIGEATWISDGATADIAEKTEINDGDSNMTVVGKSGFVSTGEYSNQFDAVETDADGTVKKFKNGQMTELTDFFGTRYFQDGEPMFIMPDMPNFPDLNIFKNTNNKNKNSSK